MVHANKGGWEAHSGKAEDGGLKEVLTLITFFVSVMLSMFLKS